jgi:hypothetical protein
MGRTESDKIRGDTQTHRQQGDHISLLLFFQNKVSRLKTGKKEVEEQEEKKKQRGDVKNVDTVRSK